MRTIRLDYAHPDDYVRTLFGRRLGDGDYDRDKLVGGEDADVFKPDGTSLLKYRANAIRPELCDRVRPSLRKAAQPSYNRGMAAGRREATFRRDGRRSNTLASPPVLSGVVGYFDRTARLPFCRTTEFSWRHRKDFGWVTEFAQAADGVFARECPDRHAAQMAAIARTPAEWIIPGTSFTTVTVNRNFPTGVHTDKGDLPEGFGVLTVVEDGGYDGCYLVFPKYRVAVDLRTTDVLLADVHDAHGNTGFVRRRWQFERLTCVFYFRAKMVECGTRAEEVRRAKERIPGSPLNGSSKGKGKRTARK